MESSNKKDLFFAVIRHSERADEHFEEGLRIENSIDPPITSKGFELANKTGLYLKEWLSNNGYE